MKNKINNISIDEYINQFESDVKIKLIKLREVINKSIPNVVEKMSYGMPTFYYKENIIHFAAYKRHIGIYPTPSAMDKFRSELIIYKTSKGAFQVPIDSEIPYELIKKIIQFRLNEKNSTYDI